MIPLLPDPKSLIAGSMPPRMPRRERQTGGNWAWKLREFEEAQVRYREDPLQGQPSFRYLPGTRPVLVSAPHGACHWRHGFWKGEDEYTAALAHVLAEHTGAHALYTLRRIRPDSNSEGGMMSTVSDSDIPDMISTLSPSSMPVFIFFLAGSPSLFLTITLFQFM